MATSSAITLADLALTWDPSIGSADLSLIDSDLASDEGMITATLLSLFLDRRAFDDDLVPSADVDDRRGWWADQFLDFEGDMIGSRMWLLDRSAFTGDLPGRAEEYIREALQWEIDDRVASRIDVDVDVTTKGRMLITVGVNRPGRKTISFSFAHVWDHQQ